MIYKDLAVKDFNEYKKASIKHYNKKNYSNAMHSIEMACRSAYHLNYCFSDSDIENLLSMISKIILDNIIFTSKQKNYVFYDSLAIDNRGLSQQYIRALISYGVNILYIIQSKNDLNNSKDIIKELNNYNKAEIFIVPKNNKKIDKVKMIYEKVVKFKPERAFLHMMPWDVIGVVVWNAFPNLKRYLINFTDHAFWIGISCADYFLEFREYGYNMSKYYRGIDVSKLLLQPYYPIITDAKFLGLPNIEKNTIKLFSGGYLYKIYGENGIFMEMIKQILMKNPNTVLFFAGDGNRKPLNDFIKKNNLQNRWILLGNRRDIVSILLKIDIYIGTYPLAGGLMTHLAAYCKKPIVAYTDEDLPCNQLEDLFEKIPFNIKLTYTDKKKFFDEIDLLINNTVYRVKKGALIFNYLNTPQNFNANLNKLLDDGQCKLDVRDIKIDTERFCKLYFDTENKFLHLYPRLMLNKIMLRKNPIRYLLNFLKYFYFYDKNLLKKTFLRKANKLWRKKYENNG